ncbi:phenylacetate--CoA ligase family protein, partial [Candidatus Bathyarchaeota archaeon]
MSNWFRMLNYIQSSKRRLTKPRQILIKEIEKKIRYLVKYSYENVPFYNKLFKENDLHPDQIKEIKDLNKIPIIEKHQLKQATLNDLISSEYKDQKLHHISTGGSTGEPFTIYLSDTEKEWRQVIQLRANLHIGQKFYSRWASMDNSDAYEKHRDNTPFFPHISIPTLWDNTRKFEKLVEFKPEIIEGLSSTLWSLVRYIKKTESKGFKPRLVFGTGEIVSPSSRELMEEVFETPFFDQISCTETGRTAWECKEKTGYHMNIDSVITQFIDDEETEVASGERGEMVYTSLHNLAMPILRYNIHDVGVPID